MATQLDLQEQEQVDALKAFWKQYGNLITWTLTLALAAFAAWNGWNWYQREQAVKASVMHDEIDQAVAAGDMAKAVRVFGDLRERFPGTSYAQQAGLALAKLQADKGDSAAAVATLAWVAEKAAEDEFRTLAQLRLAAIQLESKKYDEAAKALDAARAPGFEALVADRRGDLALAQGKRAEAVEAYRAAWKGLSDKVEYRQLVEAKLTSLAAAPSAAASGAQP